MRGKVNVCLCVTYANLCIGICTMTVQLPLAWRGLATAEGTLTMIWVQLPCPHCHSGAVREQRV